MAIGGKWIVAGLALVAVAMPATAKAEGADTLTVLHLNARQDRAVPPDRVHAMLRAEATASDAVHVQGQINTLMTAALARAKAVPGITVETGGYSVYQDRGTASTNWHGSQTLSLTGKDASTLLALTGTLQSMGLAMSDQFFDLAPETARGVEDELTAQALGRLRLRAAKIAEDMGLAVVRFRDLQVGSVDNGGRRPVPMRAMAMSAKISEPVAESGDVTVGIDVSAEILLGPKDTH